MSQEELDMKPYKVETEDGYLLTLFHITSTNKIVAETMIKGAVLLHHGTSMDGQSWFDTKNESLPYLLLKAGFSVYLSNDRGTRNSQRHNEMHPIDDAKDFYDFSFTNVGLYDVPANLNFVKQHNNANVPIIYIGYAQGATSLLYALTDKEKAIYFKNLLDEVVVLAPCVFLNEPVNIFPGMTEHISIADQLYKSYEKTYDYYDQVGVYTYNGPDKEADANKLCHIFGEKHPECRMAKKPSGFGQTFSVKSQQHISQNKIEGRFQEFSDTYALYDKYLKDKVIRRTE